MKAPCKLALRIKGCPQQVIWMSNKYKQFNLNQRKLSNVYWTLKTTLLSFFHCLPHPMRYARWQLVSSEVNYGQTEQTEGLPPGIIRRETTWAWGDLSQHSFLNHIKHLARFSQLSRWGRWQMQTVWQNTLNRYKNCHTPFQAESMLSWGISHGILQGLMS